MPRTAAASHGRHLFATLQLAYLHLHTGRTPADARASVDSVLAARPLESILPGDRPYDELARFYAAVGDLPRARTLLAAAHDNDRALGRNRPADRSWTRGVIAFAEGRAADAVADLRHAADTHPCPICVLPDLARAYRAHGDHDGAIAAYERYIATPWLWRFEFDAVELGPALIRLGELYEQRGHRTNAAAAYSRLLRLWHRADGAARVESEDVRRRIIQLRAG